MPQKMTKKAFLFHASYLDVMEEFPEDRRGKIAMALIDYGLGDYFNGDSLLLLSLNPEERIVLNPIIETIDIQKRRYENKRMIDGAIKIIREQMIETMDSDSENNNLNKYELAIEMLEQKLYEVTRHNLDIMPQEIELMLPQDLRHKFHTRFMIKTWEEQFKDIIEKWVKNNPQMYGWVTAEIKEQVYKDMIFDFSKYGNLNSTVAVYLNKYKEHG